MSTPNLDATEHRLVSALAKYNFQLEYQKGRDNAVADALSRVTTHLPLEAMQAILDGATVGMSQWAERERPAIIKNEQLLELGGACSCWMSAGGDACNRLGQSSKRGCWVGCSPAMAGFQEEGWSKDASWGVCNGWRGPDGVEKLPELHISPGYSLFMLHPEGRRWGSVVICGAQSTLDCHPKWMSLGCWTPRTWPNALPITRMFLVAGNGQTNEAGHKDL